MSKVLEKVCVESNFIPAGKGKVRVIVAHSDIDAISSKIKEVKYLFLKLVEAMRLPEPDNPNVFQTGEIIATIDIDTRHTEVEFTVKKFQGDVWGSVQEQYNHLNSQEMAYMEEVAQIAMRYDPDEDDGETIQQLNDDLAEIMKKSCLIKNQKSLNKLESLGFKKPGGDEPIISNLVSSRIKQISQQACFDFQQKRYVAQVMSVEKSVACICISDAGQQDKILFIPTSFNNTNHVVLLFTQMLASRPFEISFHDLEQLQAGSSKNQRVAPREVFFSMDYEEAKTHFEAFHEEKSQGQQSIFSKSMQ